VLHRAASGGDPRSFGVLLVAAHQVEFAFTYEIMCLLMKCPGMHGGIIATGHLLAAPRSLNSTAPLSW